MSLKKISIIILIISCGCDKPLPLPTKSGRNIMGCKIDGKNWIANDDGGLLNHSRPIVSSLFNFGNIRYLNIVGFNTGDSHVEVQIPLLNSSINTSILFREGGSPTYNNGQPDYYYSKSSNDISIKFTKKDTVRKIFSGTFSGTLIKRSDSTQSVKITKGRFDVGFD